MEEIDKAYRASDLVISRAGGGTVTEIAAFCLPAVLVPYPYAGGHQRENALVLVERNVAQMIEEKDLSPERLQEVILSFVHRPLKREEINEKTKGVYHPDAAVRVAKEVSCLSR